MAFTLCAFNATEQNAKSCQRIVAVAVVVFAQMVCIDFAEQQTILNQMSNGKSTAKPFINAINRNRCIFIAVAVVVFSLFDEF